MIQRIDRAMADRHAFFRKMLRFDALSDGDHDDITRNAPFRLIGLFGRRAPAAICGDDLRLHPERGHTAMIVKLDALVVYSPVGFGYLLLSVGDLRRGGVKLGFAGFKLASCFGDLCLSRLELGLLVLEQRTVRFKLSTSGFELGGGVGYLLLSGFKLAPAGGER